MLFGFRGLKADEGRILKIPAVSLMVGRDRLRSSQTAAVALSKELFEVRYDWDGIGWAKSSTGAPVGRNA